METLKMNMGAIFFKPKKNPFLKEKIFLKNINIPNGEYVVFSFANIKSVG